MKNKFLFLLLLILVSISGCARLTEFKRVIWGSSIRALEDSRGTGLTQIYQCYFLECFNDSINIGQEKGYTVFLRSDKRKVIVFMNIPGSIDTTEVGVFFKPHQDGETSIEVVSLSTRAKETVAADLFAGLNTVYQVVD